MEPDQKANSVVSDTTASSITAPTTSSLAKSLRWNPVFNFNRRGKDMYIFLLDTVYD